MKSRGLPDGRSWILVFEDGDEAMSGLEAFAEEQALASCRFEAIGAFRSCVVGFFDPELHDYRKTIFTDPMEVLSLRGSITRHDRGVLVHAHVVLGRADATAHGGHLLEGRVFPTLEVHVEEAALPLIRATDPVTKLPLIDLDASAER